MSTEQSMTLQRRMALLLRDAHEAVDAGDLRGAAEYASAALAEWKEAGRPDG